MSTFNGLPAHVLLVHFIVVLVPLTALTTSAGEWLDQRVGDSPVLSTHTELGDTRLYFSSALLVAVALLAFVHVRESRNRALKRLLRIAGL